MHDAICPLAPLSPLGHAMLRTFTGWIGVLGMVAEAERRRIVVEAVRILVAELPARDRDSVLADLRTRA